MGGNVHPHPGPPKGRQQMAAAEYVLGNADIHDLDLLTDEFSPVVVRMSWNPLAFRMQRLRPDRADPSGRAQLFGSVLNIMRSLLSSCDLVVNTFAAVSGTYLDIFRDEWARTNALYRLFREWDLEQSRLQMELDYQITLDMRTPPDSPGSVYDIGYDIDSDGNWHSRPHSPMSIYDNNAGENDDSFDEAENGR